MKNKPMTPNLLNAGLAKRLRRAFWTLPSGMNGWNNVADEMRKIVKSARRVEKELGKEGRNEVAPTGQWKDVAWLNAGALRKLKRENAATTRQMRLMAKRLLRFQIENLRLKRQSPGNEVARTLNVFCVEAGIPDHVSKTAITGLRKAGFHIKWSQKLRRFV